jgi:hypothetical protein
MAAVQRDITFTAGDGYRHKLVFKGKAPISSDPPVAIDVTGYVFEAAVKAWWTDDEGVDFEVDEDASDRENGIVWIFLTSEKTASGLLKNRSVWDVQFRVSEDQDPETFLRGNARVEPQATA